MEEPVKQEPNTHDILEAEKEKQAKIDRIAPWMWKKGQSGNPNGRPKGFSLKEWTRERIASMTDEERDAFLEGMPKEVVWKMSEGNPESKTDITTGGKPIEMTASTAAIAKEFEEKIKKEM